MKNATLKLETLTCPSCIQKIEAAMKRLEGVNAETVKVMFNASKVKATFDSEKVNLDQIVNTIESMGYEVLKATEK
ncbi:MULTISPECIES: heavy-metal-associated domain-containing protein [unclassified Staphylococcus]|uniref:heavy-metal-associated domain-containing protein n=1 Tax=unclassified Staphylococcus TaxID=91994 RepID=UPI0021D3918E|nr:MULTISPECIES: heavy-metal-associated domain-containing protein [unclassified Staphylococcus]UXR70380.1 cation transporter [Staphylococcus sp. IVB6246]UXR72446.1 cation transporter [Staphylococcus sp. IVB6240]UXR74749.1 cation transporter [Staphylococcus sp. IVB6238]UXR77083.1 cation transporter [Staphylococcus sp. IVB6233]UXR81208.1 cation transporter [Staphylococcus sp. IVB6218]